MNVQRMLSAMALEMNAFHDPNDAIDRIAHYAREAVGADDSGLMLAKSGGRFDTPAGTSGDVTKAHQMQADVGEGPCLAAINGEEPVYLTNDAAADERWPVWGPRLAQLGYHSVISTSLRTEDRVFGSLNAYSRDRSAFDQDDVEVMELLGVHTSVAYSALSTEHGLVTALDSRTVIGQAQGLLMAVYDLDPAVAFEYLKRLSQHGNTKLVDVCRQIVAERHELRENMT